MTCKMVAMGVERIEYCPPWSFEEDAIHSNTCTVFDYSPLIWIIDSPWSEPCIHCLSEFHVSAESIAAATKEMYLYLRGVKSRPQRCFPVHHSSVSTGICSSASDITSSTSLEDIPMIFEKSRPQIGSGGWAADDKLSLQLRSRLRSQLDTTRLLVHAFLMKRMAISRLDKLVSRAVAYLSAAGVLRPSLDALDLEVSVPVPDGFYSYLRHGKVAGLSDESQIRGCGELFGNLALLY
ncbi:hypothetical protein F4818DRAFT_396218 [Hypoxylon cercidicola]|nr:hypothetical protein F4818DRAFT_396218 [Hypoxylon cercidicola]